MLLGDFSLSVLVSSSALFLPVRLSFRRCVFLSLYIYSCLSSISTVVACYLVFASLEVGGGEW